MSTTSKVVLSVVVIVLILVGIWYFTAGTPSTSQTAVTTATTNSVQTAPATTSDATEGSLTTSNSDTSNAAILQDTNSIDSEMQGMNTDSAAVNQSMNAQ